PALEDYLPQGAHGPLLLALVQVDLEQRLTIGQPARIEDYLQRYPELAETPASVLELIATEYRLRIRAEPDVTPADYATRFAHLGADLPEFLAGLSETTNVVGTVVVPDFGPVPRGAPPPLAVPGCVLEGELGQGGMGIVYRIRDLDLGRALAVKVLKAELRGQPLLERRFLAEAQLMGQLQHPGIPPIHRLGRLDDGRPFFTMKLVQGQTLSQMLKDRA